MGERVVSGSARTRARAGACEPASPRGEPLFVSNRHEGEKRTCRHAPRRRRARTGVRGGRAPLRTRRARFAHRKKACVAENSSPAQFGRQFSTRSPKHLSRSRARTHYTTNNDHVPQDAHFCHCASRLRRDPRRECPEGHPQGTTRGTSLRRATRSPLRDWTSGRLALQVRVSKSFLPDRFVFSAAFLENGRNSAKDVID